MRARQLPALVVGCILLLVAIEAVCRIHGDYTRHLRGQAQHVAQGGMYFGESGRSFTDHIALAPKLPGVTRIVCIGDSMTHGPYVAKSLTWPSRLQEDLGPGYELINLARSGTDITHQMRVAEQALPTGDVDLVILQMCPNDFWTKRHSDDPALQWHTVRQFPWPGTRFHALYYFYYYGQRGTVDLSGWHRVIRRVGQPDGSHWPRVREDYSAFVTFSRAHAPRVMFVMVPLLWWEPSGYVMDQLHDTVATTLGDLPDQYLDVLDETRTLFPSGRARWASHDLPNAHPDPVTHRAWARMIGDAIGAPRAQDVAVSEAPPNDATP